MSSKNKMLIFGLNSTSDDQLSDLSDNHQPKHKKLKKLVMVSEIAQLPVACAWGR